jgi:PPOX class probable F420-dependent enzyme
MPAVERPAMADYGVPADATDALPWEWAEQRLLSNRNFWVVTASAAGRPHSMPVWGVWIPEAERFWFSCSPNARKARNIRENPQCVVTVDDTVECVSVEGTARIVDPALEAGAVAQMVASYASKYGDGESSREELAEFVQAHTLVEVAPDRAFGIIERADEFAQRATRWRW